MDRTFYMDSFERLLREKSDEFRMYPARKVWNSIYNNIYPGRRWPSAIIGLMLVTTLPLIGYLNSKSPLLIVDKSKSLNNNSFVAEKTISSSTEKILQGLISIDDNKNIAKQVSYSSSSSETPSTQLYNNNALLIRKAQHQSAVNNFNPRAVSLPIDKHAIVLSNNTSDNLNTVVSVENTEAEVNNSMFEKKILFDNYFIQNGQLAQKWSDKLALQVYASPSVVYGVLSPTNLLPGEGQDNSIMNQTPSIGLEAGTAMQYSLSNIIKVKAGLQFNYASYDIAALQNTTAAILSDATTTGDIAYSNGIAPVTLHNETYQFSLPVGLEMKLLKSNKLQWSAGATIQPTYIAGGNAYLLSSDSHNYIDESSLINRWNLNAGFETFITYKIDGVTWQLGPQFRYQFLSTYNKNYSPIDEKVAIFGVKIGVTKLLH
jgi:hypothetical protein